MKTVRAKPNLSSAYLNPKSGYRWILCYGVVALALYVGVNAEQHKKTKNKKRIVNPHECQWRVLRWQYLGFARVFADGIED